MIPVCPICNKESKLVSGEQIYPNRKDLYNLSFYRCSNHTDYYVGCHKGTNNALGILANREHRSWKIKCHAIFDPLWKSRKNFRKDLYCRLAHAMNIPIEQTHFGEFSVDQLKQAYEIIKDWK